MENDGKSKGFIEALKELIFNAPDRNAAKIEFFKDEIASGRYQIDCMSIAEKMIEHHDIPEVVEEV